MKMKIIKENNKKQSLLLAILTDRMMGSLKMSI